MFCGGGDGNDDDDDDGGGDGHHNRSYLEMRCFLSVKERQEISPSFIIFLPMIIHE